MLKFIWRMVAQTQPDGIGARSVDLIPTANIIKTAVINMNEIVQVISTVGFPIACSVAMAVYIKYVQDKNREQIQEMNKMHKEEIDTMKEALVNNTIAINKLVTLMERKNDDG